MLERIQFDECGLGIDQWILEGVSRYGALSLFLPAGETLRPVYGRWRFESNALFQGVDLIQVDEVLEGPKAGIFAQFFRDELPGLSVSPPQADRIADLAILGVGTNGHVAFHEPHLPLDFAFGEVSLSEESAKRIGAATHTKAISYGVGAFKMCKSVLLVARGSRKQNVFERALSTDSLLPVAELIRRGRCKLWADF